MTKTDAVLAFGAAEQLLSFGVIGIGKQWDTGGTYVHLGTQRCGGWPEVYRSMAETGCTPVVECCGGGQSIEMYVEIGNNRIMCMLTPDEFNALRAARPDIRVIEKEGYL